MTFKPIAFRLFLFLLFLSGFFPLQAQLSFTPNLGQVADETGLPRPDVAFTASAPGAFLFFFEDGYSTVLQQEPDPKQEMGTVHRHRLDFRFEGAAKGAIWQGSKPEAGISNFYLAHCPDGVLNVPAYRGLALEGLYPGIDLVFKEENQGLKYDLLVKPGADPAQIRLRIEGANAIVQSEGNRIELQTSLGKVTEEMPLVYVKEGNNIRQLPAVYTLDGNVLSFEIEGWNAQQELVIDPVSTWATFYGGSGTDYGRGVCNDNSFAWHAGETSGGAFPVSVGASQSSFGGSRDAYVVKWSNTGTRIWSTYFGGSGRDVAEDVANDNAGNVYISGYAGNGLPTTAGAFQPSFTNREDAFVAKFNASGALQWATYAGGEGDDRALDVTCDPTGNVIIAGYTDSNAQISSSGVVQGSRSGNDDAFVMKFNSTGARQWGTYMGGSGLDEAHGVAADASGNVIIAGRTYGPFPVGAVFPNTAFQTTQGGGFGDMDWFITKLNPNGTLRLWSTYYGGSNTDRAYDVEVDAADNVIVTGNGWANFPTTFGTIQPFYAGGMGDGAIAKFDPQGNRLWATYLGGSSYDLAFSVDAVGTNDIIIGGETQSFWTTINACQTFCGGTYCGFIVHLDGNGSNRIMSTIVGGSSTFNSVLDISVDNSSNIFSTGFTTSANFPVGGAATFQPAFGGGSVDGFMGVFNDDSCNAVVLHSQLGSLSADWKGDLAEINWNRGTYTGDVFVVERGTDGENFQTLPGEINENPALKGQFLNFQDREAGQFAGQVLYYRIRASGLNGEEVFSEVATVQIPLQTLGISVFPNPVSGQFTVALTAPGSFESIALYNLNGKMLRFKEGETQEMVFDTQILTGGVYFVEAVESSGLRFRKKVIIRH